jgi:hypothetical protein
MSAYQAVTIILVVAIGLGGLLLHEWVRKASKR